MCDVTEQRRMEAELRGFADAVAHDLRERVTGIAHLVTLLERRAEAPPDPAVLGLLRASTARGRGHGGRIRVPAAEGGGSELRFTLPGPFTPAEGAVQR